MRQVFADTSWWIALFLDWDPRHQNALAVSADITFHRVYTTREVLIESLNFVSGMGPRVRLLVQDWFTRAIDSSAIVLLEPGHDEIKESMSLYRARPDKSYSLTDCISFVVMRNLGITEALTHDRHFEREGFTALLRTTE